MKYRDWLQNAHEVTSEAIVKCFNNRNIGGWDENHITTQVLDSLIMLGSEFDWEGKPQKIKWEALKLKGKQENNFGDIAIIVRVWLTSDISIEGVAYYEAKRQFFNSQGEIEGFRSLKAEQLSRIGSNTFNSQLLLYDVDIHNRQAIAVSLPSIFGEKIVSEISPKYIGRTISHYGKLWVESLGDNLLGLNLDFRENTINDIREAAVAGKIPYIINASVSMLISEPILSTLPSDLDHYEHIGEIQKDNPRLDESDNPSNDFKP